MRVTRHVFVGLLMSAALAIAVPCGAQPPQRHVVIATTAACRAAASRSAPVAHQYSIGDRFTVGAEKTSVDGRWLLDSSRIPSSVAAGCWIRADLTADWSQPERALVQAVERLLSRTGDVAFEDFVAVDNFLQQTPAWTHEQDNYLGKSALLQLKHLQLLDRATQSTNTSRQALQAEPLKNAWFWARRGTFLYFESGNDWVVPASTYWVLFDKHRRDPVAEDIAWTAANGHVLTDECYVGCQLQRITDTYGRYLQEYPEGKWVEEAVTEAARLAEAATTDDCINDEHAEVERQLQFLQDVLRRVMSAGATRARQALRAVERRCER